MGSDQAQDARSQVLELLRNEKTRKLLAEQYGLIHADVESFRESDFPEELGLGDEEIHPAMSKAFDVAVECDGFDMATIGLLQTRVIDHLEPPHIITITDLDDEFWRHMRVPVEEFDSAFQVFLWNIETRYLRERSPRAFAIGELVQKTEKQENLSDDEIVLWPDSNAEPQIWSKNGIVLEPIGKSLAELDIEQQVRSEVRNSSQLIYVKLEGRMSESASVLLRSEMVQILRSIIRTVAMMTSESGSGRPRTLLPQLTSDALQVHRYFISKCLDSYFSTPPNKAKCERRIQNAIQLLAEVDIQFRDGIALALTVTAIEALLGKGSAIAKTISENVAILLEPELEARRKAENFVKRLYDTRSRVLHGDEVSGTPSARTNARLPSTSGL